MKRFVATRPRRREGTWELIYIDLMTNLMVFFVLLWAINSREQKGVDDTPGDQTVKMVNLPGDVLFSAGKTELTADGRTVFKRLFDDPEGSVLRFETTGLVQRQLVIHGHTDSDGDKEENLELGYRRALAAYREMKQFGAELSDNVVICSHADNTPAEEVPAFSSGQLSKDEAAAVREAKAKNRRITIEDLLRGRAMADNP